MNITITLSDPKLVRKLEQAARRDGQSLDAWLPTKLVYHARAAMGLADDLTIGEVATRLNCHPNTVKNYLKAGRFPNAYWRSSRACRIPLKDVEALKANTI